ncbi:MAG: hypothetical protein AAFY03_04475 [Pseudomonadota bacterium]
MRLALLTFLISALLPHAAQAQVETFGAFRYSPQAPGILVLAGPIPTNAGADLQRALDTHATTTLALLSVGGDVSAALALAKIVGGRALDTVIPPEQDCASTCAVLFAVGERRRVYGRLGVHLLTSPEDGSTPQSDDLGASLLALLRAHEVPSEFIRRMSETPPDSIYWFSTDELRSAGIETLSNFRRELDALAAVPELTAPEVNPSTPKAPEPSVAAASKPLPAKPSFDCSKAATATEFALCEHADVADMDARMAEKYLSLRRAVEGTAAARLVDEQRRFLSKRNGCGAKLPCLREVYSERLDQLGL